MKTYNLCLLGFGNVNRTLVELLQMKSAELRQQYDIDWRITGIASRSLGWRVNPAGLCCADTPRDKFAPAKKVSNFQAWLQAAKPDVLFEATTLNVETGQPAIDHIGGALEYGAHVVTANKGPVVHAYRELRDLATQKGRCFFFESTVMDGIPIFSLFRSAMPTVQVKGFRGILNSTTNVILSGMEEGLSLDDALRAAQRLGVAETDASHDIDGWDAAVKVAALVNVVMDFPLAPTDVERQGVRELSTKNVQRARAEGRPYKLVCRAQRTADGVRASVGPEQLPLSDPMALAEGTSSIIHFSTDMFPGITITEENPGLYATAYGMLADFVRAVAW
jgi:homoserine dehydrogenase